MATGFGGVCCVYDDHVWLPTMVEACRPAVDRLFFLVGRRPWNGEVGDNHATLAAIRACADPDRKIVVIEGDWPTEAAQRNAGLQLCAEAGLPYCMVVDADEIYDPAKLKVMMAVASLRPEIPVWGVRIVTYWKSYRYRIDPLDPRPATLLVRVGEATFVRLRETSVRPVGFPPEVGICHHLSYARTDEQILKKTTRFSHAHEIRSGWFQEVWRRWDENPSMENLHPVRPVAYPRAVLQDPNAYPPVLRRLYERDQAASLTASE